MDIKSEIWKLLQEHPSVVIPEVGGFIARYRPAQIIEQSNRFKPPAKEISFNENLKKDDKLIMELLINRQNLTALEAEKSLKDFAKEVLDDFNKGKKVYFDKIGFLFFEKNGKKIAFEPEVAENLLMDAFGLDSFSFPVRPGFNKEAEKTVHQPHKTNLKEILSTVVVPPSRKKRVKIFWFVLIGFLLVCSAGLFMLYYFDVAVPFNLKKNSSGQKEKIVLGSSPRQSHIVENEKHDPLSEHLDESTKLVNALYYQEEKQVVENKITGADTLMGNSTGIYPSSGRTVYYIIAGSFKNIGNARKLYATLAGQGHEPEILTTDNNTYRITLKKFSEKDLALKELMEIRNSPEKENISVWVLSLPI